MDKLRFFTSGGTLASLAIVFKLYILEYLRTLRERINLLYYYRRSRSFIPGTSI